MKAYTIFHFLTLYPAGWLLINPVAFSQLSVLCLEISSKAISLVPLIIVSLRDDENDDDVLSWI